MLLLLLACRGGVVPLGDGSASQGEAPSPVDRSPEPAVVTVDCAGGGDFTTISEAIAAAESGDAIAVAPCTYTESLDFGGKSLSIASTDGSGATTLQAAGGAAVTAENGEGVGTELVGFTVTGGGDRGTAAVVLDLASLRLEDVVLTGNSGTTTVYNRSGDLELEDVTVSGNSSSYGYAFLQSKGSTSWRGGSLDCDGAYYGLYLGHGAALLDDIAVDCPDAYATWWEHEVGRVQRSVLTGSVVVVSEDDHYDDTLYVVNSVVSQGIYAEYGSLVVRNSVVYGGINLSQAFTVTVIEGNVLTWSACAITTDAALYSVRNNLFYDNTANACGGVMTDPVGTDGNLEGDPLFVDARGGDWSLGAGSPAVDAGPEDAGYEDVDGSRNDIGVYGGPFSIGGGW